ncbi:hypothetical protein ACFQX7_04930 [Luedemannella flava]
MTATARRVAWHLVCLAALAVLLYPVVWLVFASVKPAHEILSSLALLPGGGSSATTPRCCAAWPG